MARPTILLADNEPDFLIPAAEFLRRSGYDVICVNSPVEAIKELKQKTIAMAFLDYRLRDDQDDTDNSGLKIALDMMGRFSIPLIIMTGHRVGYQHTREAMGVREGGKHPALYFLRKEEGLLAMVAVIEQFLCWKPSYDH